MNVCTARPNDEGARASAEATVRSVLIILTLALAWVAPQPAFAGAADEAERQAEFAQDELAAGDGLGIAAGWAGGHVGVGPR